jgi:hypothetical protein
MYNQSSMYNFLSKNGQVVAFSVGVVLVLIFLATAVPGAGDYYFDGMSDEEIYKVDAFNIGIFTAIALAVICAAGMLLFGLVQIASNLKGSIKGILGLAVIAILMFAFYSMSQGSADHPTIQGAIENYTTSSEGREITAGNLKWISSAIRMGLLMAGVAFVALFVMPIISPIINRVK